MKHVKLGPLEIVFARRSSVEKDKASWEFKPLDLLVGRDAAGRYLHVGILGGEATFWLF